jgi:hypothetical protein
MLLLLPHPQRRVRHPKRLFLTLFSIIAAWVEPQLNLFWDAPHSDDSTLGCDVHPTSVKTVQGWFITIFAWY